MRLWCAATATVTLMGALLLARPAGADQEVADEVLPAYAPLRVVGVVLETGQALFWDERTSEYRLGRVGEELYGWKIVALEPKRVLVAQSGVQDQLELQQAPTSFLPVPAKPGARRELPSVIVVAEPPAPTPAPAAPAATPSAPAPSPAAPAPAPTAPPAATAPPRDVPAAPPPATSPALLEESYSIARVELERELTDFGRVMAAVQVKAAPGGGFVITHLQAGSWLTKIGLREGDVVRSVVGERVSTVDDAARVYARLRGIRSFNVEIERGSKHLVLRYQVV